MTESKEENILDKLDKSNGEIFQIIGTVGEILHLKGETTGQDLKISAVDIFRGIEKGIIKLKHKPIPVVKIDGRKRKRIPQKEE